MSESESPPKLKPHEVSYRTLYPDTDPEAEQVQLEIYRGMPPWKKMKLVLESNDVSRALVLAGIRARHPDAGEDEIRRRFLGIWLGEDLATEVYGPLEAR
jgi:hypothetical protein